LYSTSRQMNKYYPEIFFRTACIWRLFRKYRDKALFGITLTNTVLQLLIILRKLKKRRILSVSRIRRFHVAKITLFLFSFVVLCHEFYRVFRHMEYFRYFFYGFFINAVILENKRRHFTCLCNQCSD